MRQPEVTTDSPLQPTAQGFFRRIGNWLFSQRHFHLKLLSGTAVGALVICFLAGIFLYVTVRNHVQETLRSHIVEIIRLSSLVENDVDALETGHRGFLLTGDQSYVTSFERRRDLIQRFTHSCGSGFSRPKPAPAIRGERGASAGEGQTYPDAAISARDDAPLRFR